ncbi:MAG: 16S rRNA (guanine(527)-N(7))-methyltransferase RsmG [Chloroflexi bacterium]|nr:16S rRNA (guanine(527)-N(7))-methyltransferase RsmG [Chloroflexota bacterium]
MDRNQLMTGARAFGVELSEAQTQAFAAYLDALLEWNAKFNLTAITDPAEVVSRHFLDSLSLFALAERYPVRAEGIAVIDVGTGAGLPGLALKIVCPTWQLTLLEATRKKCDFLEHVVSALKLTDVHVAWGRAETVAHQRGQRERHDLVLARALAEMNTLAEYLLPFARVGGLCVAWKGETVQGEVNAAKGAFEKLGGKLDTVKQVHVPGIEAKRHLIVGEKVAPTPDEYPRREGLAAKKPLR